MGHYKVIFLGLAVAGSEEEARLMKGLQKKFNLSPERAERLLQRVPVVVKKGPSREEMEKYMKAFEEIGGKVRLEEEPIQEFSEVSQAPGHPEVSQAPEQPEVPQVPKPEKKPYIGKMITCPQCGFEQPETDDCMKCGIIISKFLKYEEIARSPEGQVREISSEERQPKKGLAWESGEGFLGVFFKTILELLFSPTQFFKKVADGEGYGSPLLYGLIAGIIGLEGTLFWQVVIASKLFPILIFKPFAYGASLLVMTILLPFVVALSILIGSAVTHLCLAIVGGNKNGFQSTFRVVSYSFSAEIFGIVPLIGGTIGSIYAPILTIIGVRESHGISTGRAVLAVLLPWIILFGFGIIAAIFIPMFVGSMRFGIGV